MNRKSKIVLPAAVAAAGFIGVSGGALLSSLPANAATSTTDNNKYPSIVQKLADTFHLDPSKVESVFQQNRQDHLKTRLDQAVKDGKLTSSQETALLNELDSLHSQVESGQITRQQLKTDLDQWAKDNNLDLSQVMPSHGMRGHMMGDDHDADDNGSTSSSSATLN